VRVVGSFGLNDDQLPSDAVLWDDDSHHTQGNGKWSRINKALDQMAEWHRQAVEKIRQEHVERLNPITGISTMRIPFEDRGLIRMIRGEEGIVAIWSNKFRWGREGKERVGLLGIALRRDADKFVLAEAVSDFNIPAQLIGNTLPLVWDPDKPEIKLQTLSRTAPDVFNALKMIELLLLLRLRAEQRFDNAASVAE
jgi:hypothetical protein